MRASNAVLRAASVKTYADLKAAHVAEHQRLFRRVRIDLGASPDSALPTDERLKKFDGANDPALAALLFQFGRYVLISSSRAGTQPANLQGIWNKDMNPMWDSKYTTNINTEMNYWPAEVANLAECAEPLFRMIRELTDQGSAVAREHYGARGWVFHQNTDIWRVAAPMDGPNWGGFATGGAWLTTHLWEHYRFTGDKAFLAEYYPVMKGAAEFLLDFLVPHPKYGWLVTNPSTSPENFPLAPGQRSLLRRGDRLDERRHRARGGVGDRHATHGRPLHRGVGGRRDPWRRCGPARPHRGREGAAGADARGEERRPPGVARGLGAAREEPPPHLEPLRPVPRHTDSRSAGRQRWPPQAASSSTSAAFPATDGRRHGKRPPGRGSTTPAGPSRTSSTR